MRNKLDNYKKIKALLSVAKKTFLDEKGQEIMPTLENLDVFRNEFINIGYLIKGLEEELVNAL